MKRQLSLPVSTISQWWVVRFDEETFSLVNLLRRERRRSFQQLAEEAFRDLLQKYGHPIKLKDQLRESVEEAPPPKRPARRRKS